MGGEASDVFLVGGGRAGRPREPLLERLGRAVQIRRVWLRCLVGEVVGTFVLVWLGCSCNAQITLSGGERGGLTQANIGWGLAVAFGITSSLRFSGGHINPAFTLIQAAQGRLPLRLVPVYVAGQTLGAFLGGWAVLGNFHEAIDAHHGGGEWTGATAAILAPIPHPELSSVACCLLNQALGTATLMSLAVVLVHPDGMALKGASVGLSIGAVVAALTTSMELGHGATFNPARDLGARLVTPLAGWGWAGFGEGWWVGVLGPLLGVCIAVPLLSLLLLPNFSDDPLRP